MRILIFLTVLMLSGCTSPMFEYTDTEFNYLTETPVSTESLTGYWVGMSSNTQENFQINADGTGLYCSEYGVNSSVGEIKVIVSDGMFRLINPSWHFNLTNGKDNNQKILSSSLSNVTKDFPIYRVTEKQLSLHCRQQIKKYN